MKITVDNLGKRFQHRWVIRGFSTEINSGERIAIKGHNGSGKSTLIKMLSGYLSPSTGQINYSRYNTQLNRDQVYQFVSVAAPYIDLIDEFSVFEMLQFHYRAKASLTPDEMIERCYLTDSKDQLIKNLSSGMLQRLKLTLCLSTYSDLYILDEPGSNLDSAGKKWYRDLLSTVPENSTVIIASNEESDFGPCHQTFFLPHVQ